MWVLVKQNTGETFPMLPNIKYVVGKLGADLVQTDDKSISATHAYLTVKEMDSIALLDSVSKNGTFVNKGIKDRKPIQKNLVVNLRNGDLVQFGVLGNSWQVHNLNIHSAHSGLKCKDIEELECHLKDCGGQLVSITDRNCTHLTMSEIKITLKFINALLSNIQIVDVNYWQDLIKVARREKKGPMGSVDKYSPRISEDILKQNNIDLRSCIDRKSVFVGKTFIFLSQNLYETFAPIVEKAGGSCRKLKNGVQKAFLLKKDVIVVQYIPSINTQNSQCTQTINTIAAYLEENSRRFIPDYEIALAIVHCSTEKYCNPDYKVGYNIIPSTPIFSDPGTIFVKNTNENISTEDELSDFVVPETEISQQAASPGLPLETSPIEKIKDTESSIGVSNPFSNKKRTRSKQLQISDSESDTEMETCLKKTPERSVLNFEEFPKKPSQIYAAKPQTSSRNTSSRERVLNFEEFSKKPSQIEHAQPQSSSRNPLSMSIASDSDDDLFNFGDDISLKPVEKKRRISQCTHADDKISYLCCGGLRDKEKNATVTAPQDKEKNATVTAPKFTSKSVSRSTILLKQPKILPKKLSLEGWKTFSKNNLENLFSEINNQQNTENLDESIKGGFQIKISNSHICDPVSLHDHESKNQMSNQNPGGFKKFVKQAIRSKQ